ncbi:9262_t:CDS:2 [Entrophospora sp. SA101]|nr:9262_t:CDS:2 [Entrophospora sp. SA101]
MLPIRQQDLINVPLLYMVSDGKIFVSSFSIASVILSHVKSLGLSDSQMNTASKHDDIQILQSNLIPLINNELNKLDIYFEDYNASVRALKNVQEWLKSNKIKIGQVDHLASIKLRWLQRRVSSLLPIT